MKNTKHTENLDNSTPQEITSQSKRKILTSIGVSSGILGASALSQQWTKPIVNSIILPAHAQTTDMMGTDPMDGTDPMTDPTTPVPTTAAPTTDMPEPTIGIHVEPMALGVVNAWGTGGDTVTRSVAMRLNTKPTSNVTVMSAAVAGDTKSGGVAGTGPTVFTILNWDKLQQVDIVISQSDTAPANRGAEGETTVKFTADGGGYGDQEAEVTFTAGYYNDDHVSDVKATAGEVGSGEATVEWKKGSGNTRAMAAGYRVVTTHDSITDLPKPQTVAGMRATIMGLESSSTPYTFTVTAIYGTADADGTAPSATATII